MIIAREKRKENIAEYLLYMFQIEDLIRAYNLNLEKIDKEIISQYDQPYDVKRDIREWYKSLIGIMKDNNLEESGHIPLISSLINELNDLHLRLLSNASEMEYQKSYERAGSALAELKERSGDKSIKDVEVALNGLYGLLILRLQKKKINPETEKAFGFITEMMALLSQKFHSLEQGKSEY